MRRILLLLLSLLLSATAVRAQQDTPATPTGPLGEIGGTIIDQNTGKVVDESLEVMLHVMNLDYVDMDMVHG